MENSSDSEINESTSEDSDYGSSSDSDSESSTEDISDISSDSDSVLDVEEESEKTQISLSAMLRAQAVGGDSNKNYHQKGAEKNSKIYCFGH